MSGIIGYGAYIPTARLHSADIARTLGSGPGGRASRAVANYDEDSTSLGVEAARAAIANSARPLRPEAVYFATTSPAYTDKTNSTVIHAALGLDSAVFTVDTVGAVRSTVGAVRAGLDGGRPALAVLSDVRTGLPGSNDERDGGDAAVALAFGDGTDAPVIAEFLGAASATKEFLDRWRAPGERATHVWEERFAEGTYVSLAEQALTDALKAVNLEPDALDRAVVAGLHTRAVRRVAGSIRARNKVIDALASRIGNSGAAYPWVQLAAQLDIAAAGETIAVIVLADGVDVLVFRTTDAIADYQPRRPVEAQIGSGRPALAYAQFLTWRGLLDREPPRRPDPQAPAAPPSLRSISWKYGFVAGHCEACGTRNVPPQRVCTKCHAVDQFTPEPLADVAATVATMTVDHLAFSPSPPVIAAVIDFDGGGRLSCEITEVDAADVALGDQVEMTFRLMSTANGIHNYFWKARPKRIEVH